MGAPDRSGAAILSFRCQAVSVTLGSHSAGPGDAAQSCFSRGGRRPPSLGCSLTWRHTSLALLIRKGLNPCSPCQQELSPPTQADGIGDNSSALPSQEGRGSRASQ